MKKILFIITLFLCQFINSQIDTFTYTQTFSNVSPPNFTSTPGDWSFTNNNNSRTGAYSATIDDKNKYMYIKLSVKSGHTYTLTFWSKNICRLRLNVNDTPDQNSLLQSPTNINNIDGCEDGDWAESTIIYTPFYDGVMYFQISARDIDGDDGYLDDITITENPPISLPITLLYFTAKNVDQYNRIEWATASEDNNDYFLLEKTKDGTDFSLVCRVNGAGNSSSKLIYEYYDLVAFDGIVYYRLKQVDYDGVETKYDMVSVDNRMKSSPALKKITNVLGQNISDPRTETILFFHYDDGSIVKRYFSEY